MHTYERSKVGFAQLFGSYGLLGILDKKHFCYALQRLQIDQCSSVSETDVSMKGLSIRFISLGRTHD
jgi:hypothetical protein